MIPNYIEELDDFLQKRFHFHFYILCEKYFHPDAVVNLWLESKNLSHLYYFLYELREKDDNPHSESFILKKKGKYKEWDITYIYDFPDFRDKDCEDKSNIFIHEVNKIITEEILGSFYHVKEFSLKYIKNSHLKELVRSHDGGMTYYQTLGYIREVVEEFNQEGLIHLDNDDMRTIHVYMNDLKYDQHQGNIIKFLLMIDYLLEDKTRSIIKKNDP